MPTRRISTATKKLQNRQARINRIKRIHKKLGPLIVTGTQKTKTHKLESLIRNHPRSLRAEAELSRATWKRSGLPSEDQDGQRFLQPEIRMSKLMKRFGTPAQIGDQRDRLLFDRKLVAYTESKKQKAKPKKKIKNTG